MVVPYTQLSSTASQPRFSSASQKAAMQALQQHAPQFGAQNANPTEHAQTPPKRSWLKTLLVGIGTLIGIAVAGKFAFKHASGAVSERLTAALGEEVVRDIGSRPLQETLQTAGTSLFGKVGTWLTDGLKPETVADFIISGMKSIPPLSGFAALIPKEELQKALNPATFKALWNEITTHKLYSFEAIKTYLAKNADSLSPILGEPATSILKHLFPVA